MPPDETTTTAAAATLVAAPAATAVVTEPVAAVVPAALVTAPVATDPNAWLPEKFRVAKDDGTVDEGASARKLAESYTALEKRAGAGDVVPETVEGYKFEPTVEGMNPEEFKEFVNDPLAKGFIAAAHAKGISNASLNFVLNEYVKLAPDLFAANAQLSATEAQTELGKLWADPAERDRMVAGSQRAFLAFGGEAADMPGSQQRLFEKFGNDPDFIAFAAKVSREMGEDKLPNGSTSADADIDVIMKSKPYWDANEPTHAQVKARVAEHFARKHGSQPHR